jgi:hypothetical protein
VFSKEGEQQQVLVAACRSDGSSSHEAVRRRNDETDFSLFSPKTTTRRRATVEIEYGRGMRKTNVRKTTKEGTAHNETETRKRKKGKEKHLTPPSLDSPPSSACPAQPFQAPHQRSSY